MGVMVCDWGGGEFGGGWYLGIHMYIHTYHRSDNNLGKLQCTVIGRYGGDI